MARALTPTSASCDRKRLLSGGVVVGPQQKGQDVDVLPGSQALGRLGRHRLDAFEQSRERGAVPALREREARERGIALDAREILAVASGAVVGVELLA